MPNVMFRSGPVRVFAAALVVAFATAPAAAQESRSAVAAKALGETLDQLKLEAIAAPDPSEPGVFVAALYFAGAQLLVVSAKYSAPTLLIDKLAKKEYRDIYIDLSSASIVATKVFIMDQGANGLAFKPNGDAPADSWEHANKTTMFDGEWKKAKLTEDEYAKAFSSSDARYAQILSLLSAQAKKTGAGS